MERRREEKDMKKRWYRTLVWRRALIAVVLLAQLALLFRLTNSTAAASWVVYVGLQLVSLLVCLYIISKKEKDAYKLTWVFLILLVPLFGGVFYMLLKAPVVNTGQRRRLNQMLRDTRSLYRLPGAYLERACATAPAHAPQMRYLERYAGYPVYGSTQTQYLPSGEAMFRMLLAELEQAQHYIFLEFFIIEEGVMWNSVLEVLRRKAAQGVQVRLLYDDMGCFLKLPADYPRQLEQDGIQCMVFNPFRPFLSSIQNNRDHRKIAAIDGKVAFTGGVNLADEYINVRERFGHWKDAAIVLRGVGAWSLTLMFLEMWGALRGQTEDLTVFYPWQAEACPLADDGLVQPYADIPLDVENVGEHVYRQIIENAKSYVYIMTPYLIPDETLLSAISVAAKSGVDVRIITPHRWDKKLVHMTTRSYYRQLLEAGVRIYEYSAGFLHAKTFVSDDTTATVGTTNLDYRSLYLHFECGVWMYGARAVQQVKEDFLVTLATCQEMTRKDCRVGFWARLGSEILHVFAPLM